MKHLFLLFFFTISLASSFELSAQESTPEATLERYWKAVKELNVNDLKYNTSRRLLEREYGKTDEKIMENLIYQSGFSPNKLKIKGGPTNLEGKASISFQLYVQLVIGELSKDLEEQAKSTIYIHALKPIKVTNKKEFSKGDVYEGGYLQGLATMIQEVNRWKVDKFKIHEGDDNEYEDEE